MKSKSKRKLKVQPRRRKLGTLLPRHWQARQSCQELRQFKRRSSKPNPKQSCCRSKPNKSKLKKSKLKQSKLMKNKPPTSDPR